jgi:signal peptidase II
MQFGGDYGKIILSVFRIFAVIGIGWYITNLAKNKAHKGYLTAMALIFAGALGNIIDSVVYGKIFTASNAHIAQFVSWGKGYANMLHGRVVDMLYFPLIDGFFPEWLPIWGGEYFMFFRPVFNIADSAITVGVAIILLFQKRFFPEENTTEE